MLGFLFWLILTIPLSILHYFLIGMGLLELGLIGQGRTEDSEKNYSHLVVTFLVNGALIGLGLGFLFGEGSKTPLDWILTMPFFGVGLGLLTSLIEPFETDFDITEVSDIDKWPTRKVVKLYLIIIGLLLLLTMFVLVGITLGTYNTKHYTGH